MSVDGVTSAIRTALATTITNGGVTCRPYDEWDIQTGSIATLGIARWSLADGSDQRHGIRRVTLPVIVYQLVDGSVTSSIGYLEAAVENVIDGLGADPTLGAKVAYAQVDEITTSYYRYENGQEVAVAAMDVVVVPFSNRA